MNECDPLRGGMDFYRKCIAAGVQAEGKVLLGTVHATDNYFQGQRRTQHAPHPERLPGLRRVCVVCTQQVDHLALMENYSLSFEIPKNRHSRAVVLRRKMLCSFLRSRLSG